jgi:uncharacterized protein involved in exopolysaccharide biosynthesis
MPLGRRAVQNSIRDILDVIFRYKLRILAVAAAVIAVVTLYNVLVPETYESQARLLIRRGREDVSVDPSVEGTSVALLQNLESEVHSELAILKSQQLAEQVVNKIGASAFLAGSGERGGLGWLLSMGRFSSEQGSFERAVRVFVENLAVEVERKSQIITVSFDAGDAELAHTALDDLIQSYMDLHIEVHAAKADPGFFEDQVEVLKEELSSAEQRLDAFRRQYAISSLDMQTEALLAQIRGTEDMIDDASGKASASQAQISTLEKAVEERPQTKELSRTTGVTNWAADDYKKRLAELRLKEADLAARYEESYRPLVELRQQIKQLEGSLAEEGNTHTEVTTGIDDNRKQLELELERQRAEFNAQEARLKALSESLATYQERYTTLSAQKVELDRLQRDVALAESAYRKFRESLEESKISVALDKRQVSNVSVVQPAVKPFEPIRPKRTRNIGLGVLLGILSGIALAFLSDYFDDSIKTDSDVSKRLGLPVLASIPEDEFTSCI